MAHVIEEDLDGCYSLCVFNAESYSDPKLNEIFGKFGSVVRVNRHNNTTFIRYKTLREATLCYETMKNDERLTVKPGKKKTGSSASERSSFGKVEEMSRNDNFHGRKSYPDGGGDGCRHGFAGGPGKPPALVPFASYPADEKPSQSLPMAKVVVIGNLHPNMKQYNVYKLCTTAHIEPLHVAMKTIKIPSYPTISHAYVYVRDDEEVDTIVSSLNKLQINGYTLVVESSDKLSGK